MPITDLRRGLAAAAALGLLSLPAQAAGVEEPLWTLFELERLEYQAADDADTVAWEGQVRIGTDENKIALNTEGEYDLDADAFEKVETQLLYLRPISDFFDLQVGLRHDFEPDPSRSYAVLGVNGLAPHWLEVDANLFLSEKGDASARLDVEYDILITQRLILQPAVELNVALSDDEEAGVFSGVTDMETGLRLRYEVSREVAPYIGVNYEQTFGETADHRRAHGEDTERFSVVAGLRSFF
ncbi:MAG: copper resistance protein B [Caenispirillum sp.]|nr:copper resistance protein B [Caenispirillum sp.]